MGQEGAPPGNGGAGTLATAPARWEDCDEEMRGPLDALRFGAALGTIAISDEPDLSLHSINGYTA